jgi:hypothetical protein
MCANFNLSQLRGSPQEGVAKVGLFQCMLDVCQHQRDSINSDGPRLISTAHNSENGRASTESVGSRHPNHRLPDRWDGAEQVAK